MGLMSESGPLSKIDSSSLVLPLALKQPYLYCTTLSACMIISACQRMKCPTRVKQVVSFLTCSFRVLPPSQYKFPSHTAQPRTIIGDHFLIARGDIDVGDVESDQNRVEVYSP